MSITRFILADWGFYLPGSRAPTIFATASWDRVSRPSPAGRSQGASMLELNSLAFLRPRHLFQIWTLRPSTTTPTRSALFRATRQREKGKGQKNSHSLSFRPLSVTRPSTNQSPTCCLTYWATSRGTGVRRRGCGVATSFFFFVTSMCAPESSLMALMLLPPRPITLEMAFAGTETWDDKEE